MEMIVIMGYSRTTSEGKFQNRSLKAHTPVPPPPQKTKKGLENANSLHLSKLPR